MAWRVRGSYTVIANTAPAVSPIQGLSRGHPKVARGHPKVLHFSFPTYSKVSSCRQPSSERPWLQDVQAQGGNPHTVVFGHSQLTTDMRLSHYGAALTVGHFSCGSVRRSNVSPAPVPVPGPAPALFRYCTPAWGPLFMQRVAPSCAREQHRKTDGVVEAVFVVFDLPATRRYPVGFISPEPERVVCKESPVKRHSSEPRQQTPFFPFVASPPWPHGPGVFYVLNSQGRFVCAANSPPQCRFCDPLFVCMTGLRGKFETPTQFYPRYGYGIRVVDRWFTVCCRPWHFRACQPLFCESASVSENSTGYVMGLKARRGANMICGIGTECHMCGSR